MKVELIGGSYQDKYADFNTQRSINWYPVLTHKQEKKKDVIAAFPTPGLVAFTSDLGDSVKCIYTVHDLTLVPRCFALIDNILYEIFTDGATTNRGILIGVSKTYNVAYMKADATNNLMIVSDGLGYTFNLQTNVLSQITDIDFPGADTLEYVDGYFIITPTNSQKGRVVFSNLNDPTTWTGADVFTPTAEGDPVLRVISWREELYLFGSQTIEVYLNDGTPFSRRKGTTQPYGILAKHSAALSHVGIFFVGQSRGGSPSIYQYQSNYTLNPISPPSINWRLGKLQNIEDCVGYVQYTKDGHIFYFLHVPEAGTTLVYDATAELWHERQSKAPYPQADGSPIYGMFRGTCMTHFEGLNLFGDRYSGQILKEDFNTHTEDGTNIKRLLVSPIYAEDERYISVHRLELVINDTVGAGYLNIRASNTGGNSWHQSKILSLGKNNTYGKRFRINKLGRGRRWAIQIDTEDAVDIMLTNAVVTGDFGAR